MTGAEHYAEAEKLIADSLLIDDDRLVIAAQILLLAAQVHATLATAPDPEPEVPA